MLVPVKNSLPGAALPSKEKFPPGRFKPGDMACIKYPARYTALFENPGVPLEVADVHYFKWYAPPIYVLREPGGVGVTPFHDNDLMP
jgi:hypothetical protein